MGGGAALSSGAKLKAPSAKEREGPLIQTVFVSSTYAVLASDARGWYWGNSRFRQNHPRKRKRITPNKRNIQKSRKRIDPENPKAKRNASRLAHGRPEEHGLDTDGRGSSRLARLPRKWIRGDRNPTRAAKWGDAREEEGSNPRIVVATRSPAATRV